MAWLGGCESKEFFGCVRVLIRDGKMQAASEALENLGHDLAIESANIK